ncbi:D-alanyl-D-alanine carboxypeptidase family protein, partial [Albidovulum sp.]|uniref:D-alanyl-D-alanine carboxypeptidase family protein n=1 Tax=Albidovulum sp. TaxID=1872424 RepID=UPI0025C2C720
MAFALAWILVPLAALAAPYADYVIDVRTGEVLHQENADTRLHPASLTKMMTLYIAFEAIERGEITLDSKVTISKHAAAQPPSRLGLKAGQTIALRYLIRAAAIKSANDAATAIGEAIEGSEPAFAKRMNRTAKALGMTRSSFVNANGLTAKGHLSTAHDMTILGRHLFYDYPQYYNIFSRTSADAGVAQVASTNRRFLAAYKGADGIKTGYTQAAGFNLVASAHRGNKHVIATVFGGKSTADRNARAAQLLDMGFGKAPNRASVQKPARPTYTGTEEPELLVEDTTGEDDALAEAIARAVTTAPDAVPAGKTLRLKVAVAQSPRPRTRPLPATGEPAEAPAEELLLAMQDDIAAALAEAQALALAEAPASEETAAPADAAIATGEPSPDAAPEPAVPVFAQTATPQPETALALAAATTPD